MPGSLAGAQNTPGTGHRQHFQMSTKGRRRWAKWYLFQSWKWDKHDE